MRRGFTIIECVIAAFVLICGFMAVASVFPQANRQAVMTRDHQAAVALARSVLDALAGNYLEPPSSIYHGALLQPYTVTEMVEGVPVTTTFTPHLAFASGRLVNQPAQSSTDLASVTVTWVDATSKTRTPKFVTMEGGVGVEP
ncbi:MAG TPA: hypothetical protein VGO93_27765 [Candidatus Xenobia bacterium]|jgi:type II secretory pathway pseudopilin PulG